MRPSGWTMAAVDFPSSARYVHEDSQDQEPVSPVNTIVPDDNESEYDDDKENRSPSIFVDDDEDDDDKENQPPLVFADEDKENRPPSNFTIFEDEDVDDDKENRAPPTFAARAPLAPLPVPAARAPLAPLPVAATRAPLAGLPVHHAGPISARVSLAPRIWQNLPPAFRATPREMDSMMMMG